LGKLLKVTNRQRGYQLASLAKERTLYGDIMRKEHLIIRRLRYDDIFAAIRWMYKTADTLDALLAWLIIDATLRTECRTDPEYIAEMRKIIGRQEKRATN